MLDVGGGEGYLANALAARNFRVSCLALPGSASLVPSPQVHVVEADLNRTRPALEGTFRYVLCGDVLEHLVDPEGTLTWLRNRLDSDGRLVASLPNSGHVFVRLNVILGRFPQHDRGLFDKTHLHFYAWRNWADLLTRAGYVVEDVVPTVIPFGLVWPRLEGTPIVRGLEGANYLLARAWRTLWAYQFVVLARPLGSGADG